MQCLLIGDQTALCDRLRITVDGFFGGMDRHRAAAYGDAGDCFNAVSGGILYICASAGDLDAVLILL